MTLQVDIVKREQRLDIGFVHVEGDVRQPDNSDFTNVQVRVLGIAVDTAGRIIGYDVWESPILEAGIEKLPFSLDIFSLGPTLDRVEVRAQARRVD